MENNQFQQQNFAGFPYAIDMVFCIDATGSMEDYSGAQTKIINMVKKNALNFYSDLGQALAAKGKSTLQLRVRIVAFRDYQADGEDAMIETDFFLLPQQTNEFEAAINMINAQGGGDPPEDALEALAYAIKSDWTQEGAKRRQVIVVWTDADAHNLGFGACSKFYPTGMPHDIAELGDWWASMDPYAQRLVLFAPDTGYWKHISENWDSVIHFPSVAGNGLAERTYDEILSAIVNSI